MQLVKKVFQVELSSPKEKTHGAQKLKKHCEQDQMAKDINNNSRPPFVFRYPYEDEVIQSMKDRQLFAKYRVVAKLLYQIYIDLKLVKA